MTLVALAILIIFVTAVLWIALSNLIGSKVMPMINSVFRKFKGGNNIE